MKEVEPFLRNYGQYNALCKIYRQRGEHEGLLEVWSKLVFFLLVRSQPTDVSRLVDGEWTDEDIHDPLSDMFTLLAEKRDHTLTQRWGVWLTKKDSTRALKVRFAMTAHFITDGHLLVADCEGIE
jgi:hypothetical protein